MDEQRTGHQLHRYRSLIVRLKTALQEIKAELDPEHLADHDEDQIDRHIEHASMVAEAALNGDSDEPVTTPIAEIAAERQRQIEIEGWDYAHDDGHDAGELACAGAAYALNAGCVLYPHNGTPLDTPPEFWMWAPEWWKPKDPRRDLIRAAALIVAELERMDRAVFEAAGNRR